MSDTLQLDNANFEKEVINSDVPVLIDFWAEWCAPCRMIAPILDDIAKEYSGRAKVTKLDVEKNQELQSRYRVTNLPTLILFKDGNPVETVVGAVSKNKIKGLIESAL